MLLPQTIDHLEAGFFGDPFEARGAHLARRADGEAIAGDDERLAAMDALAEIGHQVAERSGLPPLVERVEALGDAVRGRRDLIGVDRVELAAELRARQFRIPENERSAADDGGAGLARLVQSARRPAGRRAGRLVSACRRSDLVHLVEWYGMRLSTGRLERSDFHGNHRPWSDRKAASVLQSFC